jgi:hypothetical protein
MDSGVREEVYVFGDHSEPRKSGTIAPQVVEAN